MALALVTSYNTNFASVSATTQNGATTFTINNGEVALIFVSVPKSTTVTVSDSANRTYTFITGITNASASPVRVEAWYYVNTSGAAITVTPKVTLGVASKAVYTAVTVSGALTSGPIGTTSTNPNANAGSTSPIASINLNAANSYMFAGYGTNGAPTFTVDASDTLPASASAATSGGSGSTNTRGVIVRDNTVNGTAGATLSTSGTWSTSSVWASVGVEIKQAVTGGLQTLTKSHSADAFKYVSPIKTQTIDTLARAAVTKTHTTDAFLVRTVSPTHSTDTLKKATVSLTTLTDALKRLVVAPNHTTSSYLLRVPTIMHTTDTVKRSTVVKTHTTDAFLHIEAVKTHATDSNLSNALKTLTLDTGTDALLRITQISTHGAYATLKITKQAQDTTDAVLRTTSSLVHTVDSVLKSEVSKEFTTNAVLRAEIPSIFITDALLKKATITTHTADAYALKTNVVLTQHLTDALLGVTTYGDWSDTWDGAVQNFSVAHTTDAVLLKKQLLTHTINSSLLYTGALLQTMNALLKKVNTSVHTTSASLAATLKLSHTSDILLREEDEIDYDTDALLHQESLVVSTTNAFLYTTPHDLWNTTTNTLNNWIRTQILNSLWTTTTNPSDVWTVSNTDEPKTWENTTTNNTTWK